MSTRQINTPPIEFVTNLKAGEHGCIFYTSHEEMQKIHFAFIKSGLEDNWVPSMPLMQIHWRV